MSKNNARYLFSEDASAADIIHTIGKWKVIDLKNLYEQLNLNVTYRTLKTKVNKLQKDGIVASKFLGTRNKYVYLTERGIAHTSFNKTYEPVSEEITHDLLVGKVAQELSKYSKVSGVTMYHHIEDKHINPDAIITVNAKERVFNIGIEVELTRKSQRRIKSKFGKYGLSQDYDYCFYISNDERLLTAYRLYLRELKPEIQRKIFFINNKDLCTSKDIFNGVSCIHKDKEVEITSIIGEKCL